MNGTEWTEPGQGATVGEVYDALPDEARGMAVSIGLRLKARNPGSQEEYWGRKSNLRLTGFPLTAYDLKRIEQCEVTR